MRRSLAAVTCTLALAAAFGRAYAATYTFTTIDSPGSTPSSGINTRLFGIDNRGQILGQDPSGTFLDAGGVFTYFNAPGSTSPLTVATAISGNGQIAGQGASGGGYLDTTGKFINIPPPNAVGSTLGVGISPTAINDLGQVIGTYGGSTTFIYSNGMTKPLSPPGVGFFLPAGINDAGQIIGRSTYSANGHYGLYGFLDAGGAITTLAAPNAESFGGDPGAPSFTFPSGINNLGELTVRGAKVWG